jgi:hypothetical protein
MGVQAHFLTAWVVMAAWAVPVAPVVSGHTVAVPAVRVVRAATLGRAVFPAALVELLVMAVSAVLAVSVESSAARAARAALGEAPMGPAATGVTAVTAGSWAEQAVRVVPAKGPD